MEEHDFFIEPNPSMKALLYGFEDMKVAIKQSVEATLRFESKGPAVISVKK